MLVRHRFAVDRSLKTLTLTALGSAIYPAFWVAHQLQYQGIVNIDSIESSHRIDETTESERARVVPRVSIEISRLPAWIPSANDEKRPLHRRRRRLDPNNSFSNSREMSREN